MKKYKIKMLPVAKADLGDLIDYLAQFYPSTAVKQYDRLIEHINKLKEFPFMYEEYSTNVMGFNYRKMVVDNYLVFYVVLEDTVEVHRILHSKMNIGKFVK